MKLRHAVVLLGAVLGGGCATGVDGRARPRSYAQSMDSATSSCRQSPTLCTGTAGEEAVIPLRIKATAEAGASVGALLAALSEDAKAHLKEVMEQCANQADFEVNLRLMGGKTPTAEQCREELKDKYGQTLTRAMHLGREKHVAALACAQKQLSLERPGGFSLEQRYRYDLATKRLELVSRAEEQALIQQKRTAELRGTLVPDVVIHAGNPLQAQMVFDFKFPCPISNKARWTEYQSGHPYAGETQGEMYLQALGQDPFRVVPILGAF